MIRSKIIFIICICIFVLTSTLYVVSNSVLSKSYLDIETRQMLRNITRVDGAITNYRNSLNIKSRDWAQWDDSFQFIHDKNPEFIDSNLADTTFINLEINLIGFFDSHDEIVFAKWIDLTTKVPFSTETSLQYTLAIKNLLSTFDKEVARSEMLRFPEGILFIEALPILESSGDGPSGGTIVFGRFFDTPLLKDFEDLSQLSITLFPYDASSLPDDVIAAKDQIRLSDTYATKPLSKEIVAGYFLLKKGDATPLAILQVQTAREIYVQGKQTVLIFILVSSAAILLFGFIIFILLERLVLRRFARLSTEVDSITFSDLAHAQVHESSDDELGRLARKINAMLSELSDSQKKEQDAHKLERIASENLAENLQNIEKMNKHMIGREIKMIELKEKIEKLQNSK